MSKLRKGVIVEVNKREYIVLNDSGAFVRLSKRGGTFSVGEEIMLPDARRALPRRSVMKWASAACAAMILFAFLFTVFQRDVAHAELVAYVSIDINPSVELGLDRNGNVVQVREHNESAAELVEGLSLLGLPVEEAVLLIMETAETKLLAERSEADIVITSVILDDTAPVKEEELQQRVQTQVSQVIQHHQKAEQYRVTVWSAPKEVLQEAEEAGLSAGKMTFYLKAKASGVEVSTEQLKQESIHEVAKQYEEKQLLAPDPQFTKETLIELLEQEKVAKNEGKAALKAAKEEEKDQKQAAKQQEQQAKKEEQEAKKLEQAALKVKKEAEKRLEQLRKQEEKEAEKQERAEERARAQEEKRQEQLQKKQELEEKKRLQEEENRKKAEERAKEQEEKRQEQLQKKQEQEEKKRLQEEENRKKAEENAKEQEEKRQEQLKKQQENEQKKQEREEELRRKAEERLFEHEQKKQEREAKKQEREEEKEKKKEQEKNNGNQKGNGQNRGNGND